MNCLFVGPVGRAPRVKGSSFPIHRIGPVRTAILFCVSLRVISSRVLSFSFLGGVIITVREALPKLRVTAIGMIT